MYVLQDRSIIIVVINFLHRKTSSLNQTGVILRKEWLAKAEWYMAGFEPAISFLLNTRATDYTAADPISIMQFWVMLKESTPNLIMNLIP